MPVRDGTVFEYEAASSAQLVIDALYAGSDERRQDALPRLLGVGVQGGFRLKGPRPYNLVVLTTSGREPEWPDEFEPSTGRFLYYGDNRRPGASLHDPIGNRTLNAVFHDLHAAPARRERVPPFFVFRTHRSLIDPSPRSGRDLVFLGLAAPGAPDAGEAEDLIATWRTKRGLRFQNYQAMFTVLDASPITRPWLESLTAGAPNMTLAPPAWADWVETGRYRPLTAPEPPRYRSEAEQLPQTEEGIAIIRVLRQHFLPEGARPTDATRFEACAAMLWKMASREPVSYERITRPVVDGGRDAIGTLHIGPHDDAISLDFSLEAKLYNHEAGHRVNTGDTKRLISRLRYREFGVLVTTSVVARQAYSEIREDGHPVVIIAARDIVDTLARHALTSANAVKAWLEAEFPPLA